MTTVQLTAVLHREDDLYAAVCPEAGTTFEAVIPAYA
jgi:hypothetical protein